MKWISHGGGSVVILEVIAKGAEATLYKELWNDIVVVRKQRLPKKYRHPQLDNYIRRTRTVTEAKLMFEARKLGVPTPTIYDVDIDNCIIRMEYITGTRLREYMDDIIHSSKYEVLTKIFETLGIYAGRLHTNGIAHGDLTTSNVIVSDSTLVLIDFGLGTYAKDLESHGVDIHLLLRSLESTHYSIASICFKHFIKGYSREVGEEYANKVVERVHEIRARARYVEERIRKRDFI
ncbi:MAG: Kae1-associated kinase Bud32 [Thermoprotei archaeon]|nr:MAG: Kae1-associated kinase Bud32 [Thermoprotei archaeon]